MAAKLFLSKSQISKAEKPIDINEMISLLESIEQETNWQIFQMIRNIQENIAQSYSVSKNNPDMSVFLYGGMKDITIKIERKNKEAEISLPRNFNFSR